MTKYQAVQLLVKMKTKIKIYVVMIKQEEQTVVKQQQNTVSLEINIRRWKQSKQEIKPRIVFCHKH